MIRDERRWGDQRRKCQEMKEDEASSVENRRKKPKDKRRWGVEHRKWIEIDVLSLRSVEIAIESDQKWLEMKESEATNVENG